MPATAPCNQPATPAAAAHRFAAIRIAICLLLLPTFAVVRAAPQLPPASAANQCAACHLKLVQTISAVTHVDQWVTSRHALSGVGCERCHGGDSRTSDPTVAHRGVTSSHNPSSTVHASALPATCGRCHHAEAGAFAQSAHGNLLLQRDTRAPTCTSCHSSMAADVPLSRNVDALCRRCHSDGVEPEWPRTVKSQLDEIAKQRALLRRSWWEIVRVSDPARRASLSNDWTAASASLRGAVASIHALDMAAVDTRLAESRNEIVRLSGATGP